MRLAVSLLVAVSALAGCGGPVQLFQEDEEVAPWGHAFVAQYFLTDDEGSNWTLDLALEPGRGIADDHLAVTPAYALRMDLRPRQVDAFETLTYWFDGHRVVRQDHHCGFWFAADRSDCGRRLDVRWDLQGALPPFGVGWPVLAEDGRAQVLDRGVSRTLTVEKEGGWMRLAPGSPTPYDLYMNASNRFHYADSWLPDRMEVHAALNHAGQWFRGELVSFTLGAALPSIDPWPLSDVLRDDRPAPRLFAAAHQQVFNSGITFDEALEGLLQQEPTARDILDSGCVVKFLALPIIADSPIPDGLDVYAQERVGFQAYLADAAGSVSSWRWDYSKPSVTNPNPLGLAGPEFYSWGPGHDLGLRIPCDTEYGLDLTDPTLFLQYVWTLPLEEAGYPCGLSFDRARAGNTADHATGPVTFTALLSATTTENQPKNSMEWSYHVAQDAQTAALSSLSLPATDTARLDAGGWTPRPLPVDDVTPSVGPSIRCVEPRRPD